MVKRAKKKTNSNLLARRPLKLRCDKAVHKLIYRATDRATEKNNIVKSGYVFARKQALLSAKLENVTVL